MPLIAVECWTFFLFSAQRPKLSVMKCQIQGPQLSGNLVDSKTKIPRYIAGLVTKGVDSAGAENGSRGE
jgi:hypothetical protein